MSISDDFYIEGTSDCGRVDFFIKRVNGKFLIDYWKSNQHGKDGFLESVISNEQDLNAVLKNAKMYNGY